MKLSKEINNKIEQYMKSKFEKLGYYENIEVWKKESNNKIHRDIQHIIK